MNDEETKFNEEFDVTKAMREGQASADKFMDHVAAKAAMFGRLLAALESCKPFISELPMSRASRERITEIIKEASALQK